MTALVPAASLPPCSSDDLALVMALRERIDAELEPCEFPTENFFHAGVYVRTCLVPKDTVLAGAVIKIPTVVIVSGHCYVQAGKDTRELKGYVVLKARPAGLRSSGLSKIPSSPCSLRPTRTASSGQRKSSLTNLKTS